jgi:hypothetical protein
MVILILIHLIIVIILWELLVIHLWLKNIFQNRKIKEIILIVIQHKYVDLILILMLICKVNKIIAIKVKLRHNRLQLG